MADWMSAMARPQSTVLKQFLYQLIKDKWHLHEDIIDRIAPQLITQKDIEAFSKLIIDTWESGYLKSVQDHRAALEGSGREAVIIPEPQPPDITRKIFK